MRGIAEQRKREEEERLAKRLEEAARIVDGEDSCSLEVLVFLIHVSFRRRKQLR